VFFSTINRNAKSFLFAIVGAEYVLNMLPRGTHEYAKLIRPSELAGYCRQAGLDAGHARHGIQPDHQTVLAVGRHQRELPARHAQAVMFSNVEAVLFDLDGTLIDSAPDLGAAADKMRTDRGLASLPADLPAHGWRWCARHAGRCIWHDARPSGLQRHARGVLRELRAAHDRADLCV
jgi:hypothetical protein